MTRDELARAICMSEDVNTPSTWDHLTDWRRERYREQADALAPLLANRLARAWDECVQEMYDLGWLHDFAKSDALARNPHRTNLEE